MAVTLNESTVSAEPMSLGVARQRLLTKARVSGTKVFVDRLTLAAGASFELNIIAGNLAWFQILEGATVLRRAQETEELTNAHIVFLPAGFRGRLSTRDGAALLYAEVPDAERFDNDRGKNSAQFRVVDWTREPVLDSQYDARKRIYLVTPALFGTKAIKGEMIIYPPGTEASNHHHEGAEHFMYVLKGCGTAYANERPLPVRKGDLIYYDERERHYLRSEGTEELVFVEFFVPGQYKTVWVEGAPICTWMPSGRDIRGEKPVREIKGHQSGVATPQDV
jgi:mannose-6-phosphate isomerase-like protein (cupin superfamily)